MEDIKRYLAAEQDCIQLIAQFLLHNDYNKTLPTFIEEAVSLDYKLSEEELHEIEHIKRENVQKLLSAFQSSDHIQFFKAWRELVPNSIKEVPDYKKLTFYLHVHFAILPYRSKTQIDETKQTTPAPNIPYFEDNTNNTKSPYKKNPKSKLDSITRDVTRLDVIEESVSPSVEYDTDSLDQSHVIIDSEDLVTASVAAEEQTGMEVLKSFLALEGGNYSPQQEFLPFFALPYVSDPGEHLSFTSLFQEKWLTSLNERFYEFIHKYSCGVEVAPRLVKMCEQTTEAERVKAHQPPPPNTGDIVRRYKQARRRFSKLHRDHQNLIGVATELTSALESSVRGQAVDLRSTLQNCALIFPELFSAASLSPSSDSQSSPTLKLPTVEPLKNSKSLCCSELDVYKMKSHLLTASMKTKLLLLQAIRWRITRGSCEERDQAVAWLTRHDLLSIHGDLVSSMLQPEDTCTPHPLQQTISRLLNTVASLRAGRDYLASSQALLHTLIISIKQEVNIRLDTITSDMLLATLQKLSLRRGPRLLMIEQGMVEWLVGRLSGESPRLYTLEYSTALLLNLCLHAEARDRCPPSLLKLLTDLLDTGQNQIVPMVAGTLYCLLSHDNLNQSARQMDLESILASQLERFSETTHIQKQIETLLRLLRGDLPKESIMAVSEEPCEDDLDDPDSLEIELDADDPVKAIDELCGETLLNIQYKRIFPSQGIVCTQRKEPAISIQPTTPRSRPPTREKDPTY